MRYLIKFSYDGSNFCGYQMQPNLRTIQNELENAIEKINMVLNIYWLILKKKMVINAVMSWHENLIYIVKIIVAANIL